jgi:putative cytoplasmic protein
MTKVKIKNTEIVKNVIDLLENAREKVGTTINQTMVLTYFELGRMIVEEEKKVKIELNMGRKF